MSPDEKERVVVFGALAALGCALHYGLAVPAIKSWLLCVLALLVVLFTNPYQRWRYRHIPGPPYRPLLGNLPDFITVGSHAFFEQCRDAYGPVFKVWFGARPWVVVADADMGRRVNYRLLNRPMAFTNPLARGEVLRSAAEGLFLARDGMWSMLRKTWQPTFHSESLAGYAPGMAAETRRLVARLRGLAARGGGGEVNIWREVGSMTMSVVGSTAYGVEFNLMPEDGEDAANGAAKGAKAAAGGEADADAAADDAAAPRDQAAGQQQEGQEQHQALDAGSGRALVQAAADMFECSEIGSATRYLVAAHLMPVLVPAIQLLAALFPDERYKKLLRARETMRKTSLQLISDTRAIAARRGGKPAPAAGGDSTSVGHRPVGVAPGSFLGLLLAAKGAAGHGLSDRQMASQASVFTLAGYETTANTLSYAIYCLAAHPEAQARVLAELDALPGPQGREVTVEDLAQLPYTAAVVDEALRLYPPGANTMREARGGLELGGYAVPDDSTVMVATYAIQRDPAYWPKADAFVPERWLPGHEDLAASSPNAYLPFGSGARMCIGYRFALQEARLTLAQLYRHFTFELAPGQVPLRVRTGITMSPAEGVFVRVMPRAAAAAS